MAEDRDTGRTTQRSWKVWVRISLSEYAFDHIEDITPYDCEDKPGYVKGIVTIDDIVQITTRQL